MEIDLFYVNKLESPFLFDLVCSCVPLCLGACVRVCVHVHVYVCACMCMYKSCIYTIVQQDYINIKKQSKKNCN